MCGPGEPERPTVVAFDIIGTVFPIAPMRSAIVALGLPPAGLEGWFAAGCRDAFALAAVGDYQPFTTMLDGALEQVLAEQGLDVAASERAVVVKRLETLDPRDGAGEAFAILDRAGIAVMALSNGTGAATEALLARGGLDAAVAHVVSVDEVKLAKPRAEIYHHAAQVAGVASGALALIAAHPWDIHGAAAAGLTTAYLDADRPCPAAMRTPDLTGSTLPDLARRLAVL